MYMTNLRRRIAFVLITILASATAVAAQRATSSFTVEQIKSYPFPNELTAAATGSRIAWAFNERGLRNIWVAEGPDFQPHRLTNYNTDDGQELTSVTISADGKYVVYVRGGDHGSNFDGRNSSCRRKWFSNHPMESRSTPNSSSPRSGLQRNQPSSSSTVAHRARCCSAGTTPTTIPMPTP